MDLDTKRKLREMGADPLLAAIEAEDETLVLGLGFDERLRLVVDEAHSAFNHAKVDGLIRRAGLRYPTADLRRLDRVDERGLDRHLIAQLATCSFIDRHQNVVFQGFTGSGKSYLGCALAKQACQHRIRAHYIRMPELEELWALAKDQPMGATKFLKKYAAFTLLVIDEWLVYDETKSLERGRVFTLTPEDVSGDGRIDIDDLRWEYLDGDGDFRSTEVTALRDEADIIITNPPFSLFREFIEWLMEGGNRFSVIGNNNAVTYKDVFAHIQADRLWKGVTANSSDMVFAVPKGTQLKEADAQKAERLGYPPNDDYDFTRLGNACWFTNIDHGRRHEPLQLMTMADNLKFSRHKDILEFGYQQYDNYDAIDVGFVDAIPSDYDGMMGVPITFLDHHNPDQFEILSLTQTWSDLATKKYPSQVLHNPNGSKKNVSALNSSTAIKIDGPLPGKSYFEVDGEYFVQTYKRILIRKRG